MALWLRIYQHLLPKARAWWLTADKQLRQFFEGLTGAPEDARDFIDSVWAEIDPDTTTSYAEWEQQFGLFARADDVDATRINRIDVAWKNRGGQDPDYIQGKLQDAGFPVYIHDWWVTPYDALEQSLNGTFDTDFAWAKGFNWTITPASTGVEGRANAAGATHLQYLSQNVLTNGVLYRITYEVLNYVSGTVTVMAGGTAGTARSANGRYTEELTASSIVLRFRGSGAGFIGSIDNVVVREVRIARDPHDYTNQAQIGTHTCSAYASQPRCSDGEDPFGSPITQYRCNAFLNNVVGYLVNENLTNKAPPPLPDDETKWPHFIYFGASTLTPASTPVVIPNARRPEFERLVLQLCPMQDWIVVHVEYQTAGVFDTTFDATFE